MKILAGFFVLFFVLIVAGASSSYAQIRPQTNSKQSSNSVQPMRPLTASTEAELKRQASTGPLKQRATSEIDRQITILQALVSKVDSLTHLTPEERSTLSTQIQTEITNLQTLKSRVGGSSDDTTLKTNIKSILESHKKFSFLMPQVRLLIAAEAMDAMANRILSAGQKVQTRIDELDDSKIASELQSLLDNMTAKLNNAKAQSNAVTAAISPLEADDFPANKSTLQSAHTKLKTGMSDIRSALKDLKEILEILRQNSASSSPTPSIEE